MIDWTTRTVVLQSPYCKGPCFKRSSGKRVPFRCALDSGNIALPEPYKGFANSFDNVKTNVLPPHSSLAVE